MKRWSTYSLLLLVFATSTAAVYFHRENTALRRQIAQGLPSGPVAPMPPPAAMELEPSTPSAPAIPTVEGTSVSPAAAMRGQARDGRPGTDRRDRGQEFMARALSDPESRAAMLTRFKSQIDRNFGDYFVKQGLNETQIEMLRTLLAERQLVRLESGMLERTSDDDQTRVEAQAWRDAKLTTTEADINAILGADGLKTLQAYQDSAPQREAIAEVSRRASYAGAPLTPAANDQLLEVVRRTTTEMPLPQVGGRGATSGAAAAPVTPQAVDDYLQQMRAQNQVIIEHARTFLTQPQLEALADQQIDTMQQTEARLNFILRNPDARGAPGGFGGGPPGGGGGGRGPGG